MSSRPATFGAEYVELYTLPDGRWIHRASELSVSDTDHGSSREETLRVHGGEASGPRTGYPSHDDRVGHVEVDDHVERSALISRSSVVSERVEG